MGDKGWATPQLVETQKAQVGELQAAIKTDQALIDAAKVQLSYTRLTVADRWRGRDSSDRRRQHHQPVDRERLVVVTQLDPISLIFTLPETDLPQIQQQQQKTKTPLKVLAYSQDNTIKLDQGELGLVNNEILQTTGSIQLKANFPNKPHRLWPGELVNARLLVDTRHNGLTVPAAVVQQGPKGPYAYVVNPDNTVAIRQIKVAQISDGQALIDSGLKANEQVVIDGQYKLQPGTHVTMLHGKAARGSSRARRACRRRSHEHFRAVHPTADRHRPADGRIAGRWPGRLSAVAGGGAAERQLSDTSGHGAAAGRRSADHGVDGGDRRWSCSSARSRVSPR